MNSEQNNYCLNLMEVNKTQSVVASQPIYNEQGILLLAKGSDLSEKRAGILLQHKLMKPLEQCVGVENAYDAKKLYALVNEYADKVPALKVITHSDTYQKSLRTVCLFYERFPLLQQNLTVLALRAPKIYQQGLFSAIAGLGVAIELNLGLRELQITFVAGLFHDVGYLYLPPQLIEKEQDFTADEWKAMQVHPLIAERFLNMVPDLHKEVAQAIAHHHERIDGTGYPRQVFGDKLTMISQIVATTDTVLFNYNRYKNHGSHAHQMMLLALKLSDNVYFESVFNASMVLMRKLPPPTDTDNVKISIKDLLTRQKMLRTQFENIKFLSRQLVTSSKHPLVRSITSGMGRLGVSVVRSGILQPEQEEWMEQIAKGDAPPDDAAMIEIGVMHDQIYDQLVHLKNTMARIVEAIPDTEKEFKTTSEQALRQIKL